jgi:hypothetical protein
MQRIAIGSILARSLSLLGKNVFAFGAVSAVTQLPVLGLLLHTQAQAVDASAPGGVAHWKTLIDLFVPLVLGAVTCSAVANTAVSQLEARRGVPRTGIGDSLRAAGRRLGRVVGVALAYGALITVGFLACVVPGLILSCGYAVAAPVVAVEGIGVRASMRRSMELTDGARWDIFALMVISGVLMMVLFVAFGLMAARGFGPIAVGAGNYATAVVVWLASVLGTLFYVSIQVTAYHDLRQLRDGATRDEVARVFD